MTDLKKISKGAKESLLIEEYKYTIERIKNHEDKCYQYILLNVTAFAALFSLSGQLFTPAIPLALVSILIICSRGFSSNLRAGNFNSAYLITRFEQFGYLQHDTYWFSPMRRPGSTAEAKGKRGFRLLVRKIIEFFTDRFIILALVSFIGCIVFGLEFFISSWQSELYYLALGYLLLILWGHLFVVRDVRIRRSSTVKREIELLQAIVKSQSAPVK